MYQSRAKYISLLFSQRFFVGKGGCGWYASGMLTSLSTGGGCWWERLEGRSGGNGPMVLVLARRKILLGSGTRRYKAAARVGASANRKEQVKPPLTRVGCGRWWRFSTWKKLGRCLYWVVCWRIWWFSYECLKGFGASNLLFIWVKYYFESIVGNLLDRKLHKSFQFEIS